MDVLTSAGLRPSSDQRPYKSILVECVMCVDCGVCGVGVLDKCYQPLTQYIYIYVVILGKYFLLSNKWSVK